MVIRGTGYLYKKQNAPFVFSSERMAFMSDDNPLSPQAPILGAQLPPVAQQVIDAEELKKLRGIPHCCKCGCGIVLEQQRSIEIDKCNDCFKYDRMERRLTQVEM